MIQSFLVEKIAKVELSSSFTLGYFRERRYFFLLKKILALFDTTITTVYFRVFNSINRRERSDLEFFFFEKKELTYSIIRRLSKSGSCCFFFGLKLEVLKF